VNKGIKRQEILSSREEFKGPRKFGNFKTILTFPALRGDDVI